MKNRRSFIKDSALGLIVAGIPLMGFSRRKYIADPYQENTPKNYPNIDPELVKEVVGVSHFNLVRLKELVDKRPELAKATWEWRFGDFESAIGAASHVGNREIVNYLLSKGAKPTLFTFAMMGAYDVVKSAIEYSPGIQRHTGPHGISLLSHAMAGNRMKDQMDAKGQDDLKRLQDYLISLGDADGQKYGEVTPEEQKKYLGDYKYGEGDRDGFTVSLSMRKGLSLGPINDFGGEIYKIGEHRFTYNGVPSVTIVFEVENEVVKSLTVNDPDFTIKAFKVS